MDVTLNRDEEEEPCMSNTWRKLSALENDIVSPLSLEISVLLRTRLTGESLSEVQIPFYRHSAEFISEHSSCVHSVNQSWSHSG